MNIEEGVRLIGVRLDDLTNECITQISLFEKKDNNDEKLDKSLDILKEKYGDKIIKKAASIEINTK